jgi:hypothetical protein
LKYLSYSSSILSLIIPIYLGKIEVPIDSERDKLQVEADPFPLGDGSVPVGTGHESLTSALPIEIDPNVSSEALEKLEPRERDFNIVKAQEETRSLLAKWLLGMLCTTLLASFLVMSSKSLKDEPDLKNMLTLIITSQGTLVGTALGFYFGKQ